MQEDVSWSPVRFRFYLVWCSCSSSNAYQGLLSFFCFFFLYNCFIRRTRLHLSKKYDKNPKMFIKHGLRNLRNTDGMIWDSSASSKKDSHCIPYYCKWFWTTLHSEPHFTKQEFCQWKITFMHCFINCIQIAQIRSLRIFLEEANQCTAQTSTKLWICLWTCWKKWLPCPRKKPYKKTNNISNRKDFQITGLL